MIKSFKMLIYKVLKLNNNKIISSDSDSSLNQKIIKIQKRSNARVNFYSFKSNLD